MAAGTERTSAGHRSWFGVRGRPGRLALALFRLPVRLGSKHPERLPTTFLRVTHTGRRTGRSYETVAMVLGHDVTTREIVICAAWGEHTDWLRNLRAAPAERVQLGSESFVPQQRFLSTDEACTVIRRFAAAHPRRLRLFRALLGWGDLNDASQLRAFASTHPFVAFRPTALPG